jgi:acid phosphatase class B
MNHLNVGFDIDDVLLPSSDHTTRIHNRLYGTNVTRDNWYVNLPTSTWKANTEQEVIERVNTIMGSDEYLSGIVPMEGAIEVLDEMDAAGDERFAVTGRPPALEKMTYKALELCYPGKFPEGSVTFIDHSTASDAANTLTKVEIALEKKATHIVDDYEYHLRLMAAAGITPLLFGKGYKWNESATGLDRVEDWWKLGERLAYERRT